jgi:tetratricopeptide (TPR) repeat protein
MLLVWAAGAGLVAHRHVQAPAPPPLRLLVVPFDSDATAARTYWVGPGAALTVADELAAGGVPVLTREQWARVLDELHLPTEAPLTRATLIRVGTLLGGSHLVFGAVAFEGADMVIRARPLVLAEGRQLGEIVERGPLTDLFAVCQRVAVRVAAAVGHDAVTPRALSGAPPLDAFEAYVKGTLAQAPESKRLLLRQAVEKAPAFARAQLALWAVEMQLGQLEAALRAANAVPRGASLSREARFAAGRSLIELKRYEEAYSVLWGLADERFDAAVLNNLGVIQVRRGATPQTGTPAYYFTKATEQDGDDADVFFNRGYAYLLDRNAEAAVYWLREAVRRDHTDGDAHYVLAAALQAFGATAEASRERELARRLSARYEEAGRPAALAEPVPRGLERLKDTLEPVRMARFDRAVTDAAQREEKEMATFYVDRAKRLAAEGRYGEALTELRRALFVVPYHAEALLLSARASLRLGQVSDAADAARVAIWTQESPEARLVLAEALHEAKDVAGARAEVEKALALDPASREGKALLARIDAAGVR